MVVVIDGAQFTLIKSCTPLIALTVGIRGALNAGAGIADRSRTQTN